MSISFDGRVAIVTGAGGGLGRQHALALAARGAKVVVNDFGRPASEGSKEGDAADAVVAEIRAAGGTALANHASVTDEAAVSQMVKDTLAAWGRVDILVNNAGILRDKSFGKMTLDDFRAVVDGAPDGRRGLHARGVERDARATIRPRGDDDLFFRACTATSARPTTAPPRWRWWV